MFKSLPMYNYPDIIHLKENYSGLHNLPVTQYTQWLFTDHDVVTKGHKCETCRAKCEMPVGALRVRHSHIKFYQ